MERKESRGEARLRKKIDKLTVEKQKNVRLSNSVEISNKYIRSSVKPDLTKTPRSKSPENYKICYFSWCATQSDTVGRWKWGEERQWSDREYSRTIKARMDSYNNNCWNDVETMTYNGKGGVRKLLNKYQPLDSLCANARARWLELETLSEFEELFRFRLGTDKRIWGIRIQHHFFMVWYEREHRICPPEND